MQKRASSIGAITIFLLAGTIPLAGLAAGPTPEPTTTSLLAGTAGANGWYTSTVTVTLVCTPPAGATCTSTVWKDTLAGGPFVAYTGPFVVSGDGNHQLNYKSESSNGGKEIAKVRPVPIDATAPVIAGHDDVTAEATGPDGAVVAYDPPATTDAVSGVATAACAPASGSLFAYGDTSVTCAATDTAGNTAAPSSFTVHVVDTTAPVVSVPDHVVAEATGPDGGPADFDASSSDAVSGPVPPICDPAAGTLFPLGDTTVTCTATDAAGNTGSAAFVVSVVDTTAPAIDVHDDASAEATGPDGAAVSFEDPGATDAVDEDVAVDCVPASGTTFAVGDNPVVCTATDDAGNSATTSFVVHVMDTTSPVLVLPADIAVPATGPSGALVGFDAHGIDIVDGTIPAVCAWPSGSVFPIGTTTVECTATDAHGNSATGTFEVTVYIDFDSHVHTEGPSYFPADAILSGVHGHVEVRLVGGEAVEGASVVVTITNDLLGLTEQFSGVTGGDGEFAFDASTLFLLPGTYTLDAAVDWLGVTDSASGAYAVSI